jgi:hypothetical protein
VAGSAHTVGSTPQSSIDAAHEYIVGPLYDSVFFIGAPLLALALGTVLFLPSIAPSVHFPVELPWLKSEFSQPFIGMAIKVFIQAHLVLVFLRSHLNPKINHLHPIRFFVVPFALLVTCLASPVVLVFVLVLAIWWDVYHSALQTFGLGRMYDVRHGNDPELGRQADRILNIAIYVGPILAGTNLWTHLQYFRQFRAVDMESLAALGELVFQQREELQIATFAIGTLVVLLYLLHYRRLATQGYSVSTQKVVLLASTALCSVYAWGFLAPAKAFFVMNFFHALQYFAIVWWSEKKNVISLFGLGRVPFRVAAALLILTVPAFSYGVLAVVKPGFRPGIVAVAAVVSIMHFWYDGFVWSVRKQQV